MWAGSSKGCFLCISQMGGGHCSYTDPLIPLEGGVSVSCISAQSFQIYYEGFPHPDLAPASGPCYFGKATPGVRAGLQQARLQYACRQTGRQMVCKDLTPAVRSPWLMPALAEGCGEFPLITSLENWQEWAWCQLLSSCQVRITWLPDKRWDGLKMVSLPRGFHAHGFLLLVAARSGGSPRRSLAQHHYSLHTSRDRISQPCSSLSFQKWRKREKVRICPDTWFLLAHLRMVLTLWVLQWQVMSGWAAAHHHRPRLWISHFSSFVSVVTPKPLSGIRDSWVDNLNWMLFS